MLALHMSAWQMSDVRTILTLNVDLDLVDDDEVSEMQSIYSDLFAGELDDGVQMQDLCVAVVRSLQSLLNHTAYNGETLH
jgi:hypothetical protein